MDIKILFVDESYEDYQQFKQVVMKADPQQLYHLNKFNFEIDFVCELESAFHAIRVALKKRLPYTLVFIDHQSNRGLKCLETIQQIWDIDPMTEIVVCTDQMKNSWLLVLNNMGCSDQVTFGFKPFKPIVLHQLLLNQVTKIALKKNIRDYSDRLVTMFKYQAGYSLLLNRVQSWIHQSQSLQICASLVLKEICHYANWSTGNFYIRQSGLEKDFRNIACYTMNQSRKQMTLRQEMDNFLLPSTFQLQSQPILCLTKDWKRSSFSYRGRLMEECGFIASIVAPVYSQNKLLAVMEFFISEFHLYETLSFDHLDYICRSFGYFIENIHFKEKMINNGRKFQHR